MDREYAFLDGKYRECSVGNFIIDLPEIVPSNDPAEISAVIANLKLKYDHKNANLKFLPDTFGELKSLRVLNLYKNDLRRLPNSFGNLRNLEFLNLEDNMLKTLPDSLKDLINLKKDTYHQ